MSKQFAELHGGTMWAESTPGIGSTFYLSLPLCENVAATPFVREPHVATLAARTSLAPATVAVLGDDVEAASIFRRYLDGYRVIGGPAAGAPWDDGSAPRAVVLTGKQAPDEWTTLQRAWPGARELPVLACSLNTAVSRAKELGVADYLVKPITCDKLSTALTRSGIGEWAREFLVVDDDEETARILTRMIQSLFGDCHVRIASNGLSGLALAREHRPDTILLDLLMPEMDGYEFLTAIRSEPGLGKVPVVMVTARGLEGEEVLATALTVSRLGGLTVGEVMNCAQAALDCLLNASPPGSAPAPPAVQTG